MCPILFFLSFLFSAVFFFFFFFFFLHSSLYTEDVSVIKHTSAYFIVLYEELYSVTTVLHFLTLKSPNILTELIYMKDLWCCVFLRIL